MPAVSALIICLNEESNIEDCLRSVVWCDEIVLIDGNSSDKTIDIASKYTDRIYRNEWKGFAEQRKFGLTKAEGEWIFSLDADERCTESLAEEIKNLLSDTGSSGNHISGYAIPRKSFFLGKWIKHGGWYPDYQMRLFRKQYADVSKRLVHESYVVSGETGKLKNNMLHFTVSSLSEYVNKINHYTDLSSKEKRSKLNPGLLKLIIWPLFEFVKKYFFQFGILDGIPGLMVSLFHMITKILTYMKIWELQNKNEK